MKHRGAKSEDQRFECSWRIRELSLFYACGKIIKIFLRCSIIFCFFLIIVARVNLQHHTLHGVRALLGRSGAAYDPSYIIGLSRLKNPNNILNCTNTQGRVQISRNIWTVGYFVLKKKYMFDWSRAMPLEISASLSPSYEKCALSKAVIRRFGARNRGVFLLVVALRARQNTAQLVNILSDTTHQTVSWNICIYSNKRCIGKKVNRRRRILSPAALQCFVHIWISRGNRVLIILCEGYVPSHAGARRLILRMGQWDDKATEKCRRRRMVTVKRCLVQF